MRKASNWDSWPCFQFWPLPLTCRVALDKPCPQAQAQFSSPPLPQNLSAEVPTSQNSWKASVNLRALRGWWKKLLQRALSRDVWEGGGGCSHGSPASQPSRSLEIKGVRGLLAWRPGSAGPAPCSLAPLCGSHCPVSGVKADVAASEVWAQVAVGDTGCEEKALRGKWRARV